MGNVLKVDAIFCITRYIKGKSTFEPNNNNNKDNNNNKIHNNVFVNASNMSPTHKGITMKNCSNNELQFIGFKAAFQPRPIYEKSCFKPTMLFSELTVAQSTIVACLSQEAS